MRIWMFAVAVEEPDVKASVWGERGEKERGGKQRGVEQGCEQIERMGYRRIKKQGGRLCVDGTRCSCL